jgi:hypothetical protein
MVKKSSYQRLAVEWTSAGIGCACADGAMNPLEIIKVRMQAKSGPNRALSLHNVVKVGEKTIKAEGVNGLLVPGLLPTCLRGFFYAGFRIGMYPSVNKNYQGALSSKGDAFLVKLLAGATTGSIGSFIFNPIDVIRVRFQRNAAAYGGTFSAFPAIYREEGIRGFWTGASASVMRASLMSGSQLATYDTWKKAAAKYLQIEDTPALHVVGSVVSGIVAQCVIMPVDTVKTRVMVSRQTSGHSMGVRQCVKALLKEGGVGALFKGFVPSVMRQVPTMLIQMPLIEQIRRLMGLEYL